MEGLMTKRYRLLARAQIDGEIRDAGYVFTLAPGQKGPHRTIASRPSGYGTLHGGPPPAADAWGRDVPLYEEIDDNAQVREE
jgi:hypothetical protein